MNNYFFFFLGFSSLFACGYPLRRGVLAPQWWQPSLGTKIYWFLSSVCKLISGGGVQTVISNHLVDAEYQVIYQCSFLLQSLVII